MELLATLEENVAVYEEMRTELEANHMHQWVVIYDTQLVGTFSDFEEAADVAVTRFGPGPYHIKKIGEPPLQIAPSFRFVLTHANDRPSG
ncbi:MAG: hypothetical protein OXC83_02620 [Chloroflexi bacterium]|nr:hypothetical protein [Chloroflexota bacterium]